MTDMTDTSRLVPVAQAVKILKRSKSSIHRMIERGEIVAERVTRPQGTRLLVQVPWDTDDEPGDIPGSSDTDQDDPDPMEVVLLKRLEERDLRIAKIAGENADLREEKGRLLERTEQQSERITDLTKRLDDAEAELKWRRLPWWKRLAGYN